MAKIYIDSNGQIQAALDSNLLINDENYGEGNWCYVENEHWVKLQFNNDNKIINGKLIPNHVPDRPYWLNCKEYVLKHPDLLPEGASFKKPSDISAQEERVLRDELLRQSDWAVLPDAPLSDEKKQEWMAYRQALRDIPQQSGFPEQVVMPELPVK